VGRRLSTREGLFFLLRGMDVSFCAGGASVTIETSSVMVISAVLYEHVLSSFAGSSEIEDEVVVTSSSFIDSTSAPLEDERGLRGVLPSKGDRGSMDSSITAYG